MTLLFGATLGFPGRNHSAFEQAPIAMTLAAQDGSILQVNQMLAELIGYDVEALQRCRLDDLVLE